MGVQAKDLPADVSLAVVEIYAGSAGLSQELWLSCVSQELGIVFLTPINIGVDNSTAVAYANGAIEHNKICHNDDSQDSVGVLRGSTTCQL